MNDCMCIYTIHLQYRNYEKDLLYVDLFTSNSSSNINSWFSNIYIYKHARIYIFINNGKRMGWTWRNDYL